MRAVLTDEQQEPFSVYGQGYSGEDVVGVDFSADISSQSVVYRDTRYWILNKRTGEYSIPARRKQMSSFFGGLAAAELIRKVDRGTRDLSEWDLGEKARKLTLTYGNGVKREIFIGAVNPAGRGIFIRTGRDRDTVYLVSSKINIACEAILFQLAEDRILLAEPPDVRGFFINGKKTEEWRKNETACTRTADNGWKITFPVEKEADAKAVQAYLEMLNRLRFESLDAGVHGSAEKQKPILTFRAELEEPDEETLEFYRGASDVMGRKQYMMINRRTGLGGYVYPPVFNAVNRSFISFIWRRLFRGDPRNISRISVKKGSRTVTFIHQRTGMWTVSEYFDAQADPRIMTALLDAVMNFRVSDYVSDSVEDLERFGLNIPSTVLTIEEEEGENSRSYCYYFGKQAEGTGSVYFKEVGENEIYTVDYTFIRLLSRPARAYAVKKINDIDKKLLEWVKIIRRGRTYRFRFSDLEGWYLSQPLLTRHIDSGLFGRLTSTLEEMEFEEIPLPETVPGNVFDDRNTEMTVELKTRPQNKPELRKNLWPSGGKVIRIIISAKQNDRGNIYAKRQFTNMVFTLKPEIVDVFKQEFIDTSVFIEDISTAVSVNVVFRNGNRVVLQKKGDRWGITEPEGAAVDEKAVLTYLHLLNGLKAAQVYLYKTDEQARRKLGFGDPLISVEISKGMGASYGFSLIEHPADPAGGLIKRKKDIYILQVTAADRARIYVQPEYFILEKE